MFIKIWYVVRYKNLIILIIRFNVFIKRLILKLYNVKWKFM